MEVYGGCLEENICMGLIKGLGNRDWPKTPKNLVFKDILIFRDYWLSILLLSPGIPMAP